MLITGIIGKFNPRVNKDDIYVFELSLNALMKQIKPLKFKASPKYPGIEKDLAFIVNKETSALELTQNIRKSGGRLLTNIKVFDVYTGENVKADEKSIAFNLTFQDPKRTLTDEEVMEQFNKIITYVEEKCNAKVRDK